MNNNGDPAEAPIMPHTIPTADVPEPCSSSRPKCQPAPQTSTSSKSVVDEAAENVCQAGSSGSSVNWEDIKAAKMLFETAKAGLKQDSIDYDQVIDLLDQVSCTFKRELGDLSAETIDALYYYGTSLLEVYQLGSSPIGKDAKSKKSVRQYTTVPNEKPGTKNLNDDDGDADSDDEDCDSASSNQSDLDSLPGGGPLIRAEDSANADHSEQKIDVEAVRRPSENVNDCELAASSSTMVNDYVDMPEEKSEGEGDAIAELRYAWEILETARVGYEKRMTEGASHAEKLRLAEIHYKLSLCAAENGQQNLAIVEAERSLKVSQDACEPTDRELAEAYFNLGSVLSVYSLLSDAAENMKTAVAILENRKIKLNLLLNTMKSGANGSGDETEIKTMEEDVKELSDLIPDLMRRIQDTYEDMKIDTEEAKRLLRDWLKGVSDQCHVEAGVAVEPPKPVNDITHLVRRVVPVKKRSTEDEADTVKIFKGVDGAPVNLPPTNGCNGKPTSAESDGVQSEACL